MWLVVYRNQSFFYTNDGKRICIDESNSTFEKIVFKKKDTKPRSWEEYRAKVPENKLYKVWGVVEGKELTEAFIAMMKLMSLRQAWIGDWKPDWSCGYSSNYCVVGTGGGFEVCILSKCRYALSFPTIEMAKDFMDCFKCLLEIAKPLI